jgi:hypothetical protein
MSTENFNNLNCRCTMSSSLLMVCAPSKLLKFGEKVDLEKTDLHRKNKQWL